MIRGHCSCRHCLPSFERYCLHYGLIIFWHRDLWLHPPIAWDGTSSGWWAGVCIWLVAGPILCGNLSPCLEGPYWVPRSILTIWMVQGGKARGAACIVMLIAFVRLRGESPLPTVGTTILHMTALLLP